MKKEVEGWSAKCTGSHAKNKYGIAELAEVEKTFSQKEQSTLSELPPHPWKDWQQVENVSKILSKAAFWVSKNVDDLSKEKDKSLDFKELVDSPIGDEFLSVRSFVKNWQSIWKSDDIEEARVKWNRLSEVKLSGCAEKLSTFQRSLTSSLFDSASHYFQDSDFQTTNNSAERCARKFKKIQKTRYRLRSQKAVAQYLAISDYFKHSPISNTEIKEPLKLLSG